MAFAIFKVSKYGISSGDLKWFWKLVGYGRRRPD
jgi:hypothetical protein